ncbi:MAG: NAD(P)/FAD-dependent oxidoreductase [Oscillospiraceae bacterium]|nr:NAD(P)/FAD-dependent oxidoreductase [Oscillospiraceae bacterium]
MLNQSGRSYDVAVIGAGVVGALIARQLGRYDITAVVLERANDVAQGTTKANSAIVHAGFDAKPGSNKAKMNVAGNRLMPGLCETLHVPFRNNGSLVIALSEEELPELQRLLVRGEANGVPGLRLLDRSELLAMEPQVNPEAAAALYAPTGGVVSPYELCVAAAENAVANGVTLLRNFAVERITREERGFVLFSARESVRAGVVINAAGVFADEIARMAGDESFRIRPRRGEYILLDSSQAGVVEKTVFQCPSKMGKGVLITPTVHGNILIGPSAQDIDDREDLATTHGGLRGIQAAVRRTVPGYQIRDIITSFTGLRAHCSRDDFVLEASAANPRLIHAAGVESPGLTAAPAIAQHIAQLALKALGGACAEKAGWVPGRPAPLRMRELSHGERRAAIAKNPAYGRIVCRCETVSEGEILDAIRAPAGATDVDGVKRRTRAGMGRCQGGFCGPRVLELLARELGLPSEEITKCGGDSRILLNKTK